MNIGPVVKELQAVSDRLEAWAETHRGLAQRSWHEPDGAVHLNQGMNYQALANSVRWAIKALLEERQEAQNPDYEHERAMGREK